LIGTVAKLFLVGSDRPIPTDILLGPLSKPYGDWHIFWSSRLAVSIPVRGIGDRNRHTSFLWELMALLSRFSQIDRNNPIGIGPSVDLIMS
jgi:hypothetical protein